MLGLHYFSDDGKLIQRRRRMAHNACAQACAKSLGFWNLSGNCSRSTLKNQVLQTLPHGNFQHKYAMSIFPGAGGLWHRARTLGHRPRARGPMARFGLAFSLAIAHNTSKHRLSGMLPRIYIYIYARTCIVELTTCICTPFLLKQANVIYVYDYCIFFYFPNSACA